MVAVRRLLPQLQDIPPSDGLGRFADLLTVLDANLPEASARNVKLPILVTWRAQSAPGEGYDLRIHLTDEQGILWAQSAGGEYLSGQWQPNDLVYQLYETSLPEGIPAGTYTVRLVLSHAARGQIPAYQGGQPIGPSLAIGQVRLTGQGAHLGDLAPATPLGRELLAQAEPSDWRAAPGATLHVHITWRAATEAPMTHDYAGTLALSDENGAVCHSVIFPLAREYPTSAWQPGEIVRGIYPLTLPPLPDGTYRLRFAIEGLESALDLGNVIIESPAVTQEPPPLAHPLRASLGEAIALLGYDLPSGTTYAPGDSLSLTLHWQAAAVPAVDAKAFVHLLNSEGHLIAQDDSIPANWQRPTLGWRAGEIIVDTHTLVIPPDAPPGDYQLAIGMYDATSLQRLPVEDAAGDPAPEHRLVLAAITIAP